MLFELKSVQVPHEAECDEHHRDIFMHHHDEEKKHGQRLNQSDHREVRNQLGDHANKNHCQFDDGKEDDPSFEPLGQLPFIPIELLFDHIDLV